ncbi:hypothetical protein ACWDTP_34330 [Mycobacterium sp. NPDC003449]
MTAWLRRNRWGLLALPVTLILAAGANAQRIHDYWWDQDLRRAAVTGDQGQWVTWSDTFTDATGDSTRTVTVKVTGSEPADRADESGQPTPLGLPAEVTGRAVTMDFRAAPDQVLYGCRLALVDDDGNRYAYRPVVNNVSQTMFPCVPDEHPGPRPSITAGEPRTVWPGEERPPRWSTRPVVVVPREARITQVLLWWEEPDYLAVQLN